MDSFFDPAMNSKAVTCDMENIKYNMQPLKKIILDCFFIVFDFSLPNVKIIQ